MDALRTLFKNQMVRFMFMGGLSTSLMFILYVAMNRVLKYQIAYLIAYAITVVVSYFLNSLFVFNTNISLRTFFQFPLVYLVQYSCSAVLLELLVRIGLSKTYAPLIVIMMLLPLTYWLSRVVMVRKC